MKNVVYRNYDRYVLKHLLVEIGEHTLRMECERKHYSFPKRLGNFFLETNDDCSFLVYRYNDGIKKVMKLDRYEMPEKGWERIKIER